MSGYPEDMPARGICIAEGCEWAGGSRCVRCGALLRCVCGRFVRDDDDGSHFEDCPTVAKILREGIPEVGA